MQWPGSVDLYKNLQIFFSSEAKDIRRTLLCNMFARNETQIIREELSSIFCDDFFTCLEIGKKLFHPNRLIQHLKTMFENLQKIYEPTECVIITAQTPSKEQKKLIQARVTNLHHDENIKFSYMENSAIIGGMIVKLNGRYYDTSIRNVLQTLRLELIKSIE